MKLRKLLLSSNPVTILRELDSQNKLRSLEPSLAALRMNKVPGYNHKDNLTHSIRVLEKAIARETSDPDLILRTAALFHDIGKPATRKFGANGTVTFDAHETVGARMIKKILPAHGYTVLEIKEISQLIAYHMRSHGYDVNTWTDTGVRKIINDTGNELTLQRLIVLFYSDVTTRFPEKEKELHRSVDGLVKHIEQVKKKDARDALRPAVDGNFIMEKFGLTPGKELGKIMRFLNSNEGIKLSETEIVELLQKEYGLTFKN